MSRYCQKSCRRTLRIHTDLDIMRIHTDLDIINISKRVQSGMCLNTSINYNLTFFPGRPDSW